jgi:hypothetical protein
MTLISIGALCSDARADYVTFVSGSEVWVESWELRDGHYVFKMAGGFVSVPRDRVLKIRRQSAAEFDAAQRTVQHEQLRAQLREKLRALEQAEDELASRPNADVATLKQQRLERLREEIQQLKERLDE